MRRGRTTAPSARRDLCPPRSTTEGVISRAALVPNSGVPVGAAWGLILAPLGAATRRSEPIWNSPGLLTERSAAGASSAEQFAALATGDRKPTWTGLVRTYLVSDEWHGADIGSACNRAHISLDRSHGTSYGFPLPGHEVLRVHPARPIEQGLRLPSSPARGPGLRPRFGAGDRGPTLPGSSAAAAA